MFLHIFVESDQNVSLDLLQVKRETSVVLADCIKSHWSASYGQYQPYVWKSGVLVWLKERVVIQGRG